MKKLLTAFAIVALTAAPALAKSKTQHQSGSHAAFAAEPAPGVAGGYWVMSSDNQIGADPDPTVRLSLRRDAPTGGSQ